MQTRHKQVKGFGTTTGVGKKVCITFSDDAFHYFKYLADKYEVSFNSVVNKFIEGYIGADKDMSFDGMGVEDDIRKEKGMSELRRGDEFYSDEKKDICTIVVKPDVLEMLNEQA